MLKRQSTLSWVTTDHLWLYALCLENSVDAWIMWRKGVPSPSEGDEEAGSHSKCPSFSNGWDGPRRPDYCQVFLEILYFEKG